MHEVLILFSKYSILTLTDKTQFIQKSQQGSTEVITGMEYRVGKKH